MRDMGDRKGTPLPWANVILHKKGSHTHLYDCLILTKLMLFGLKKTSHHILSLNFYKTIS